MRRLIPVVIILSLAACSKAAGHGSDSPVPAARSLSDSVAFTTVEFSVNNKISWITRRNTVFNPGDADNNFDVNSTHTILVSNLKNFRPVIENGMDKWGGNPDWRPDEITSGNPEGYWRTGFFRGRPVFVDPDGHVALLHGVNTVSPGVSANYSETIRKNYISKYSSRGAWSRDMASFLYRNALNFCTVGVKYADEFRDEFPLQDQEFFQKVVPQWSTSHVETLSFMRTFQWRFPTIHPGQKLGSDISRFALMFDPKFGEELDKFLATVASFFKDDKNLIGYYLDNELSFVYTGSNTDQVNYNPIDLKAWLRYQQTTDAAREASAYARRFMLERGVEPEPENVSDELQDAFLSDIADMYYRVVSSAVRSHDPNHLVMGSRLHGLPARTRRVVEACARYCDVLSYNYYSRWDPEPEYMAWLQRILGKKPFIISEFYVKDVNYEFDNSDGAGWIVRSQADRGRFYQNFCIRLMRGGCAGWQWFELMDKGEPGSSNKGLITADYDYEKYHACLYYVRQMNLNIYKVFDWLNPENINYQ